LSFYWNGTKWELESYCCETWKTVTSWGANWSSGANPLKYRKDTLGIITIKGSVANSTLTGAISTYDTVTTLPAGYRPDNYYFFAGTDLGATAFLHVRFRIVAAGGLAVINQSYTTGAEIGIYITYASN